MARPLARPLASLSGGALALGGALVLAACADARARPTFPEDAAGRPVIEEQALLGFDARGDALAAQLLVAEGHAQLSLIALDRDAGPTRTLAQASEEIARAVGERLLAAGDSRQPLLSGQVSALWPEAASLASAAGLEPQSADPTPLDPRHDGAAGSRWAAAGAGLVPLALRAAETVQGPAAMLLLLSESPGGALDSEELEIARMPLSGETVAPRLWIRGRVAWLLSGSTRGAASPSGPGIAQPGELRRAVGLRRGSLSRGEAELHNLHGLAAYRGGEREMARHEFERALACDPRFLDALYNAAAIAALDERDDEAVSLLRRAAEEDPRRVEVLGRDDPDLRRLRQRPDVRELLGLARMPPGE